MLIGKKKGTCFVYGGGVPRREKGRRKQRRGKAHILFLSVSFYLSEGTSQEQESVKVLCDSPTEANASRQTKPVVV